jgi:hypothetical protein
MAAGRAIALGGGVRKYLFAALCLGLVLLAVAGGGDALSAGKG